VPRHQLDVVPRRAGRPRLRQQDRAFSGAASSLLPRARWRSFFVEPDTLLRWHRELLAGRGSYPKRSPGRPPTAPEVGALVLRVARENPRWGYKRIAGLVGLGLTVSSSSARNMLRVAGLPPANDSILPPGSDRAGGPDSRAARRVLVLSRNGTRGLRSPRSSDQDCPRTSATPPQAGVRGDAGGAAICTRER
jgi:hypothetical protein